MPITEDFKVEKKEGTFEVLPENVYQVEVLDINLEKRPTYDTKNKSDLEKIYEKVLNFQFTLLSGLDKDGKPLRGRSIFQNFVPTYLYIGKNGKNVLYQISEAILRHQLTQEEEASMDANFISSFIGSQLRVVVKHKKSGEKTYANIESFLAAEELRNALTYDEKEKAAVKNRKDSETLDEAVNGQGDGYDDIPVISIEDGSGDAIARALDIK